MKFCTVVFLTVASICSCRTPHSVRWLVKLRTYFREGMHVQWKHSLHAMHCWGRLGVHSHGRRTTAVAFFISLTKAYETEAAVASHVAQQSMQVLTPLASCIVLSVCHHNYMLSFHCHYMGLQGVRQSSCQNDSLVVPNCRRSLRLIKRRRRMLPSLWNQFEKGGSCQSASMHSSQTCAETELSIPNALLCAKASPAPNGVCCCYAVLSTCSLAYSAQRLYVWGIFMPGVSNGLHG